MSRKSENATAKRTPPSNRPARKVSLFWVCLILFVSAWMFTLGILVGRGTAPVKFDIDELQKELADLRKKVIQKEQKRFNIHRDAEPDKTKLGFYENLKNTRSDFKLKTNLSKSEPDISTKKSDVNKKKYTAALPDKMEQQAASDDTTGNEKTLTIQIASFKDLKTADQYVADLIKMGYPAYRTVVDIAGKGTWHRIRIGHFSSRDEAKSLIKRLAKEGFKPMIVQK